MLDYIKYENEKYKYGEIMFDKNEYKVLKNQYLLCCDENVNISKIFRKKHNHIYFYTIEFYSGFKSGMGYKGEANLTLMLNIKEKTQKYYLKHCNYWDSNKFFEMKEEKLMLEGYGIIIKKIKEMISDDEIRIDYLVNNYI